MYRELCLQVIRHKHECEVQGARQHLEVSPAMTRGAVDARLFLCDPQQTRFHKNLSEWRTNLLDLTVCVLQSERSLLFDAMKTELLEKIRRLEEDRQNMDLTSGSLTASCEASACVRTSRR